MANKKFELTAESIRKFREDRGLSRPVLGKALEGIGAQTIKNWEYGIASPPPYLRLALLYLVEKSLVTTITAHKAAEATKAEAHNPFA
jgi:DNA-binding transcriptional regulator YiaG